MKEVKKNITRQKETQFNHIKLTLTNSHQWFQYFDSMLSEMIGVVKKM